MDSSQDNKENQHDDSESSGMWVVIIVIIFLIVFGLGAFLIIKRRKINKSKKLEEEINKLQQYVNSCDRKGESRIENVNTQPQVLSQTNSFTKTNRMYQQEQQDQNKPTGKILLDLEKSERLIIHQQSPHSPQQDEEEKKQSVDSGRKKVTAGLKKKNLQIEIPQD